MTVFGATDMSDNTRLQKRMRRWKVGVILQFSIITFHVVEIVLVGSFHQGVWDQVCFDGCPCVHDLCDVEYHRHVHLDISGQLCYYTMVYVAE